MLASATVTAKTITTSILILVAMDVEEKAILGSRSWSQLQIGNHLKISAKTYHHRNTSVSVLQTGVGTVNAAVSLALFAESQPLTEIILLGVGGGISPHLRAGETVLGTAVVEHDCFFSSETGKELMAPGELFLSIPIVQRVPPAILTDADLSNKLAGYLKHSPRRGTILSGNEFVGSRQRKQELAKAYPDALLVEMESAGVAQIARKMKIPFAVAKTVADESDPHEKISDHYLNWIESSAETAREVISGIMRDLEK